MGDSERDKGKRKMPEDFGESSERSARRTLARTTESSGDQNGAGGNPSLPPLDLQDDRSRNWPRPQGSGEEGGHLGLQTQDLISKIDRPLRVDLTRVEVEDLKVMGSLLTLSSAAQHQDSGSVGDPDPGRDDRSCNWPRPQGSGEEEGGHDGLQTKDLISKIDRPLRVDLTRVEVEDRKIMGGFLTLSSAAQHQENGGVGNPDTSLQMNFARDSRMMEAQIAAITIPGPRPQAPSSSHAKRPKRQQTNISKRFPQTSHGLSTRAPNSGAQREDASRDVARGHSLQLQVQARAPATAGQPGAATGALGSGQPLPPANAGAVVQCPACHNNPYGGHLCGREPVPVYAAIDTSQHRPPRPPQQGFPAAPKYQNCPGGHYHPPEVALLPLRLLQRSEDCVPDLLLRAHSRLARMSES